MKSSLLAVPAICLAFVFAGCQTGSQHPTHPPKPGPTGATPTPSPTPTVGITPTPTPSPSPSPAPAGATPTPTPSPTGTSGEIPYGIPVPGKPGFVTSPFNAAGYVDVRGFPPNTEVKDPYSGKIFRVP